MNKHIKYIGIMTISYCCSLNTAAAAQENLSLSDTEINAGVELFRWQEFDTDGYRLLTESGPRLFISGVLSNKDRAESGFIYGAGIKGYSGQVDYDGQDSNGVFTNSETIYSGFALDIEGGYRAVNRMDMDILAGIGMNAWEREIKDNINAEGSTVSGITEVYSIQYSMLALGVPHRFANANGYLKLGFKRPFATNEDVDDFNVTLSPGKKFSGFVSYKMTFDSDEKGRGLISSIMFYYDSFRFSKSSDEVALINNVPLQVRQPESNLEVVGIAIGHSF